VRPARDARLQQRDRERRRHRRLGLGEEIVSSGRSGGSDQACPGARAGLQAVRDDRLAALLAHTVRTPVEPIKRSFEIPPATARLLQQGGGLLALVRDSRPLRVMLVVAVGRLSGRDDPGMLELKPGDVRGVARQIREQPLPRLGHIRTNAFAALLVSTPKPAPWRENAGPASCLRPN